MAETSPTPNEAMESSDREQAEVAPGGSGMAFVVGMGEVTEECLIAAFDEDHFLIVVDLPQLDLDNLSRGGLPVAADKTGFNRQLAMAAVDQHQQLYAPWASVVKKRIQCRADSS